MPNSAPNNVRILHTDEVEALETEKDTDEAWDLRCVELGGIDTLSKDQLKRSLKAYITKSQTLSAELDAAKEDLLRSQEPSENERKEWDIVKAALTADLVRARRSAERATTSTVPSSKKPILFYDCIGRHFRWPFHKCSNRWDMKFLIDHAFEHNEQIYDDIRRERYDLVGADDEIIMKDYYEDVIEPGMTIKMLLWPINKRSIDYDDRESCSEATYSEYEHSQPDDQQYEDISVKKRRNDRYDERYEEISINCHIDRYDDDRSDRISIHSDVLPSGPTGVSTHEFVRMNDGIYEYHPKRELETYEVVGRDECKDFQ